LAKDIRADERENDGAVVGYTVHVQLDFFPNENEEKTKTD
jgi:hypothetical protein